MTDAGALRLALFELAVLAAVYGIARLRSWSFSDFGLRLSWKLTAAGIAFVLLIQLPALILLRESFPTFKGSISVFLLAPVFLVNAFFEVSLEVGYVFHGLSRYPAWLAVIVSALLRASVHLYLGPVAFLSVFVMGILSALIYSKIRQLWPLVLAHWILDILFLWPLVRFP